MTSGQAQGSCYLRSAPKVVPNILPTHTDLMKFVKSFNLPCTPYC